MKRLSLLWPLLLVIAIVATLLNLCFNACGLEDPYEE